MNFYLLVVFVLQMVLTYVRPQEDVCDQCYLNKIKCQKISGIYTLKLLSQGYHPVVDVPAGACSINITELKNTKNYLALKSKSGHWILNGNFVINDPGMYHGAGTQFQYNRENQHCASECIWGRGPLSKDITVQLLYVWKGNKGITYEYLLPPGVKHAPINQLLHHGRQIHRRRHHHRHHHSGHRHHRGHHTTQTPLQPVFTTPQPVVTVTEGNQSSAVKINSHKNDIESLPAQHRTVKFSDRHTRIWHAPKPQFISSRQHRPLSRFQGSYRTRPYVRSSPRRVHSYYRRNPVYTHSQYQPFSARNEAVRGAEPEVRKGSINELDSSNNIYLEGPVASEDKAGASLDGYDWSISGFTECTHTCGGGTQETKIVCVLKDTRVLVTNDNCAGHIKPLPQTVVCNTSPCPAKWEVHDWSSCSVTCGRGTQTRRVECKRRISADAHFSVSASLCNNEEKPAIVQQCQNEPCTSWRIGEWGQCLATCGKGEKQRLVECINSRNQTIADASCTQLKPRSTELCNAGPCDYHWFFSDWSNECSQTCDVGQMTRSVHCATVSGEQTTDKNCDRSKKPKSRQPCTTTHHCGSVWFVGPWSPCSVSCGRGVRTRYAACLEVDKDGGVLLDDQCDNATRPATEEPCQQNACGLQWHMSDWSQCSVTCGEGYETRSVLCLDHDKTPSNACDISNRPTTKKACSKQQCGTSVSDADPNCRDSNRNCELVVQSRLCIYRYYNKICCASCLQDKH